MDPSPPPKSCFARTTATVALITSSLLAPAALGQVYLGPLETYTPPLQDQTRPLEGAIADISPLNLSLRIMRKDLRSPTQFEDVYHVPGRDDLLMRRQGALFAVFPMSQYVIIEDKKKKTAMTVPTISNDTIFYIGDPTNGGLSLHPQGQPTTDAWGIRGRDINVHPGGETETRDRAAEAMVVNPIDLRVRRSDATRLIDMTYRPPSPEERRPHPVATAPPAGASARPTVRPTRHRAAPPPYAGPPTLISDRAYRSRRIHTLMQRAADAP